MFTSNSRVERVQNGILFYEQDIITSTYQFFGDLKIDLKYDYHSPGFGIVLMDDIDKKDGLSRFVYLFRIGHGDFSLTERHTTVISTIANEACFLEPNPDNINQYMQLEIKGKYATLRLVKTATNGEDVSETFGPYVFPHTTDGYYMGVYSSAGNILRSATFVAGVPKNWRTSIANTVGGRIAFFDDGFKFENCTHDAEIEQENVSLNAGKY